jgi:hypothetical protein
VGGVVGGVVCLREVERALGGVVDDLRDLCRLVDDAAVVTADAVAGVQVC